VPTYVAGDVRNIQEYIFGSPHLLEMRGASALIDFFDRAAVPDLIDQHGGWKVFSGGGNFLARFDKETAAAALAEAVRNAFLELTGSEGITVASVTSGESFPKAHAELRRVLRRAKSAPQGVRALASMPFLKRCESCAREAADELRRVPGRVRDQWIGPACLLKQEMHGLLRRAGKARPREDHRHPVLGLATAPKVEAVTDLLRGAKLPADFQELAGDDDLALVAADGNGLGDWFEDLEIEEVKRLSAAVDAALRRALDAATEAAFPGDGNPSLQVLICGGDDLVVALPARRGLDFARTLLASFAVESPREPGRMAGIAAGLLFAKPSFPFRQAHALAVSLLGRAKARCRREKLRCALDFHRVTATQVQSLEQERFALERTGPPPDAWSYGAAGPYTPEELTALRELAGRLRTGVTASQRGRLREILAPRDDGPPTPLDPVWKVPKRVVAELKAWLARQEGKGPFQLPEDGLPADLLREETVFDGAESRIYRRFKLADALLLAELGEG
jgi:hypothetical protein